MTPADARALIAEAEKALARTWRYERDAMAEQIERLRASIGELKLVIEQQDREMERMRAGLTTARRLVDEFRITDLDAHLDAILKGDPCTTTK